MRVFPKCPIVLLNANDSYLDLIENDSYLQVRVIAGAFHWYLNWFCSIHSLIHSLLIPSYYPLLVPLHWGCLFISARFVTNPIVSSGSSLLYP